MERMLTMEPEEFAQKMVKSRELVARSWLSLTHSAVQRRL